ncbi:C-type lectin domain family 4 member F-like [Centroberyx affinis]|uniref:C-type lectin domain family 4 member F-like n=1 Tax=Centroberyx affinis TaxID=166261 RepID=UPI003A5BDFA9
MARFVQRDELEVMEVNEDHLMRPNSVEGRQQAPQKHEGKLYRLVLVSFGLLCVTQAALNISLRLILYNSDAQKLELLKMERDQIKTSNNSLTEAKDQLQTSYNRLTEERDQLQTSNNILTKQREQLQIRYNRLTKQREQLQTRCNVLTEERDQLQTSNNILRESLCTQTQTYPHCWIEFNSNWYYVSNEMKTWEESRQDCLRRGAHLVIINSKEEQKFLVGLNTRVWIGLTDREEEGTWTWVDGSPLTTAYWGQTQPDNGDNIRQSSVRTEDCGEIYNEYSDPLNKWNDLPCIAKINWICEKVV